MEEYVAKGVSIYSGDEGPIGTYFVSPAADRVILKEQAGTPSNAPLRGGAAETDDKKLSAELTAAGMRCGCSNGRALRVQKEILREQPELFRTRRREWHGKNTRQMVKERTGRDAATLSKIMEEAMKELRHPVRWVGPVAFVGRLGPAPEATDRELRFTTRRRVCLRPAAFLLSARQKAGPRPLLLFVRRRRVSLLCFSPPLRGESKNLGLRLRKSSFLQERGSLSCRLTPQEEKPAVFA
jgi:hypothetical protein